MGKKRAVPVAGQDHGRFQSPKHRRRKLTRSNRTRAWKKSEEKLARFFGSTRRPLSGGNSKTGRDDSLHPVLFLENKYTSRSALWTLYRKTRELAKKEDRIPVIGISEPAAPGTLLVIHTDDLLKVFVEYLRAAKPAELDEEDMIRIRDLSECFVETFTEQYFLNQRKQVGKGDN